MAARKGPNAASGYHQGMSDVFILSAARTPIGKFGGGLSTVPATDLGATAIRAAVERSGIAPEKVDEAIMGQVIQAGAGQSPARQASIKAGCRRAPAHHHQQGVRQRPVSVMLAAA